MILRFIAAIALIATPAAAGTLTVKVSGVKAKGGTVRVALYAGEPLYRDAKATGAAAVDHAGDVMVTIPDVPAGDYVVSAFHNADGDGKLGIVGGRMTEGSAISNAEKLRGAPTFDVNKVAIPATGNTVTIQMSYPEDRQGW